MDKRKSTNAHKRVNCICRWGCFFPWKVVYPFAWVKKRLFFITRLLVQDSQNSSVQQYTITLELSSIEIPRIYLSLILIRSHQAFWNCELHLVYRLMRRATSLIHTSEVKILLNLPSIILVLIFVNVKALIMLMSFLEQAQGHHVGDPGLEFFTLFDYIFNTLQVSHWVVQFTHPPSPYAHFLVCLEHVAVVSLKLDVLFWVHSGTIPPLTSSHFLSKSSLHGCCSLVPVLFFKYIRGPVGNLWAPVCGMCFHFFVN